MSSRTRLAFNVKLNKAGETINIQISDPKNIQADNLALATWGSSEVLANVLHRIPIDLNQNHALHSVPTVLELGAGTGLVGLSAACIWRTSVVLTDLPPILPNIQANIEMNSDIVRENGGSVVCGTLDWAAPKNMDLETRNEETSMIDERAKSWRARVIVAADTVYSEEHPELLVNAIKARLDLGPKARLVMCYPLRIGYLDYIRDLWSRMEEAGLVCDQEGRETIDESWEEDTPYEWCVWRWQDTEKSDCTQ